MYFEHSNIFNYLDISSLIGANDILGNVPLDAWDCRGCPLAVYSSEVLINLKC